MIFAHFSNLNKNFKKETIEPNSAEKIYSIAKLYFYG